MTDIATSGDPNNLWAAVREQHRVVGTHKPEAEPEAKAQPLRGNAAELRRFVDIAFRHCARVDGWVALRGFEHEGRTGRPADAAWVPWGPDVAAHATEMATDIARRTGAHRAVFSPPVALFGSKQNGKGARAASAANVVAGPVIAVELDSAPTAALATLTSVLGVPTLIVASGGVWKAPDGSEQEKRHVYWRLTRPATDTDALIMLTRARRIACDLVGADVTGVSIAHPMRWPGSWHTKGEPRLCRIVGGEADRDLDLGTALAALEGAAKAAGVPVDQHAATIRGERHGFKTTHPLSAKTLGDAVRIIPNGPYRDEAEAWDQWIRVGMSFYDGSWASMDGLEAYHAWSAKIGDDYDAEKTDQRWHRFVASPPTDTSSGTLLFLMRKSEPGYVVDRETAETWHVGIQEADASGTNPAVISKPTDDETDAAQMFGAPTRQSDVIDIFGHGDPAELGTPPADALPTSIAAWVRTEARRKGVSEAFAAASAIAVAASAIGNSVRLQPRQFDTGWAEPASLWVTLIAPPGSTKSAIISEASKPLRDLETANRRAWKPLHDEWSKAAEAFRRRKKDAPDPGPEPTFRRVVIDNYTSEKALRIFADNPRGLLNTTDELVGALGNIGAYKRSGDGDRALMLRFFDGGDAMMDRVGGGTLYAESALLGIVASSQPDKIGELANGLAGDGFLQRFLFVVHDRRERTGVDEAPDAEACQRYARIVRGLATMEHDRGATIKLSPEAGRLQEEGLGRLRALKWLFGTSPTLQGHVGKFGKFVARLILTFHCIEQFERSDTVDIREMVAPATVERAMAFAAFLMRHSLEFYREFVGRSDIASEAEWIAEFLLAHPEHVSVDKRKIYDAQKSFRGSSGHKKLMVAMSDLETANWVRARPRTKPTDKDVWDVNPTIHALFPGHAKRVREAREESQRLLQAAKEARRWTNGQMVEAPSEQAVSAFD